jgi:hypothetical protein
MGRSIDRKIDNEDQLVTAIKEVSNRRGTRTCNAIVVVIVILVPGAHVVCARSVAAALAASAATFKSVQLETMTFKEQVELMYSQTNILIGVHGAGLSHTIFLPPEVLCGSCAYARVRVRVRRVGDSRILRRRAQAILIELLPDHSSSFTYFRNLAKQSNHIYIPVIVSGGSASPLLCAPALVVCVCVCVCVCAVD